MEHRADLYDSDCPSRQVLDRIGDTWSVLVVASLAGGALRYSDLAARIGGISPKMLTQTLRALERDGMLSRTVFPEVPPHVEYELTGLGQSLLTLVDGLQAWAVAHIGDVNQARDAYDARSDTPASRGAAPRRFTSPTPAGRR
jgi:DNA-binding HxlR family transcriptional regulator